MFNMVESSKYTECCNAEAISSTACFNDAYAGRFCVNAATAVAASSDARNIGIR